MKVSQQVVSLQEVSKAPIFQVKSLSDESVRSLVQILQKGLLPHNLLLLWAYVARQFKINIRAINCFCRPNQQQLASAVAKYPTIADSKYIIVDGFKRYAAAKALHITSWGAIIISSEGSFDEATTLLTQVGSHLPV